MVWSVRSHNSQSLQLLTHGLIDLAARSIVGRDDEGIFRMGSVAFRNRRDALLRINDFRDAALLFQHGDGWNNFTFRQMLDGPQQFRVFLAHDLVKLRGVHPGLYKLLEGLSGIDGLVLTGISNEQHAVLDADLFQKVAHLFGTGKAGFIDNIQVVAPGPAGGRLLCWSRQKSLQSVRRDTCVAELLRGTGCRREAFHHITMLLGSFADGGKGAGLSHPGAALQTLNRIARGQYLLDSGALPGIELYAGIRKRHGLLNRQDRRGPILSLLHTANHFLFGPDGELGGELPPGVMFLPWHFLKLA